MRRAILRVLATLLLLAGCAAPGQGPGPQPQPAPPPGERPGISPPATTPPGAPRVEQAHGGVLVRGVRESYRWYAAGQRLALLSGTGLWSVRPDGQALELLAPPGPDRTLVGAYGDGVIYLERHPETVVAMLVRPGEEPRQVAAIAHAGLEQTGFFVWTAIHGERLLVAVDHGRAIAVDLATGKATELGDEAIPVRQGELKRSPDGRYLAYKLANRGDGVRVLDLESGAVVRPGDEAHAPGIAWAPAGGLWAVRAAEPGSGLPAPVGANMEDGGTHLDVGDATGTIRHLTPPAPLKLVAGPWWSPDSQWLAVISGAVGIGPDRADLPLRLWAVEAATGQWRSLGTLPAGAYVAGFHPILPALMVYSEEGLHLWPVGEGAPERVAIPYRLEQSPILLPEGSLLFLSADPQPRLYRQRPGREPDLLLDHPAPKGNLTVQGGYAALILYGDGLDHNLLILPLPE